MRYLLFFSTLLLFACSDSTIYRETIEIEKDGWSKSKPIVFKPHITNNTEFFNTFVVVRHDGLYKYNNLWLFIQVTNPAGVSKTDTVECYLADPSGRWYGSGLGDLKTLKLAYRQNISFPDTGIYTFSIEQAMREEPLKHVVDVAFAIEKVQ